MDDPLKPVADHLALALGFVRAGEKLRYLQNLCVFMSVELGLLLELDTALTPEVKAVLDLVTEVHEALARAFTFIDARFDVSTERMNAAFNRLEGDEPQ